MTFGRLSAAPAEPTLPRLTRLGPPTTPIDAASPSLPGYDYAPPPLAALNTTLPPLPLSQPGFAKKPSSPKSPSLHSSASSTYSRRRSSADSDEDAPPSSRSSTSTHDGHFKQFPWAAGLPARRDSVASSIYSSSPKQSPMYGRPMLAPTQFSPAPPRGPAMGQAGPRQMSVSRSQSPHVRPTPPQASASDLRRFSRTHSPPADSTFPRRMPEPHMPAYRPVHTDSPVPFTQRSQSSLARMHEDVHDPRPLRASPALNNTPTNATTYSMSAPEPAFASQRISTPSSSPRSGPPPIPTSATGRIAPPPVRQNTPPPPPMMRPVSVSKLPLTNLEINTAWSHACLLYQNDRIADAVTMMQPLNERPGAEPVTLARLNINIGIMSENLSSERNEAGAPPRYITEVMIEALQTAVKHSPDGPEGALATFLLACTLFDTEDFYGATSCFDICESIFGGENDAVEHRLSLDSLVSPGTSPTNSNKEPGTLDGSEMIDMSKLGMDYSLQLSTVRENYRIAQERCRIPASLSTKRDLQRLPPGLLLERPLPGDPAPLSPLPESDGSEYEMEDVDDNKGLQHAQGNTRATGMELPEICLDLGPPTAAPPPIPMRRRTTKRQDREEMERRREARRTRILIKLGDLRLNKPLPPLPHEREAMKRQKRTPTPKVPPLPVASMVNGMPFV